ncbi:MAG: type II toxin-antitoxin system HicB family antitoxin [Nitrospira sp.]|nr:type II toxin-antitoxin system HicB family antitoxin [Nitrospira sp.]
MSDLLEYKGYYGSVQYSREDRVFFGRVEFIKSLISYEGTDVESLEKAFKEAVDDYLEVCRGQGKEPEKSFKGSFSVRTGSTLHRKVALYTKKKGTNLNKLVADALEKYLSTP